MQPKGTAAPNDGRDRAKQSGGLQRQLWCFRIVQPNVHTIMGSAELAVAEDKISGDRRDARALMQAVAKALAQN